MSTDLDDPDGMAQDDDRAADSQSPDEEQTALRAELEVLREENRRLREEYARARRSEYRRAALVLVGAGVLALLAGFVVPSARTVLLALGGTGVFIGVLTYYLTPERLLPATVGRDVYTAMSETGASIVRELGLQDDRVYLPLEDGEAGVRLYVPQHAEYTIPDDAVRDAFVVGDAAAERGFGARPTGDVLFDRFEQARTGTFGPDPDDMAEQLGAALVEQFELLDGTDVESEPGRVTVAVTGSAYGRVDRFDHPVPSLLASGLARGLGEPVTLEVTREGAETADALVTCRWDAAEE